MADKLQFDLVSPEARVFSGEVDMVVVPGSEGDFGVLPGHAPFMSTIRTGSIEVHADGKIARTFIHGGFAEVDARPALPSSLKKLSRLTARDAAAIRERLGSGPPCSP